MGVLIGSAVIPIAYCLVWSKCTAVGAITGAVSGFCLAIMSWLVTAKCLEGELTLHSTGAEPTPIPFCCTPFNGLSFQILLFLPLLSLLEVCGSFFLPVGCAQTSRACL